MLRRPIEIAPSKRTYGAPRLHADFLDDGIRVSRKRVERLMKAAGLRGASKRKYVNTTARDKRHRPSVDLVDRNFYADEPNTPVSYTHLTLPTTPYV